MSRVIVLAVLITGFSPAMAADPPSLPVGVTFSSSLLPLGIH